MDFGLTRLFLFSFFSFKFIEPDWFRPGLFGLESWAWLGPGPFSPFGLGLGPGLVQSRLVWDVLNRAWI